MGMLIGTLLRFLVDRKGSIALVQNGDDMSTLMSLGIQKDRITLISGSASRQALYAAAGAAGPPTSASSVACSTTKAFARSLQRIACCDRAGSMPGC